MLFQHGWCLQQGERLSQRGGIPDNGFIAAAAVQFPYVVHHEFIAQPRQHRGHKFHKLLVINGNKRIENFMYLSAELPVPHLFNLALAQFADGKGIMHFGRFAAPVNTEYVGQ